MPDPKFKLIFKTSLVVLTSFSMHAYASLITEESYLDPQRVGITASNQDCFQAAPNALLLISPVDTNNGERQYHVKHITASFDQKNIMRYPSKKNEINMKKGLPSFISPMNFILKAY